MEVQKKEVVLAAPFQLIRQLPKKKKAEPVPEEVWPPALEDLVPLDDKSVQYSLSAGDLSESQLDASLLEGIAFAE